MGRGGREETSGHLQRVDTCSLVLESAVGASLVDMVPGALPTVWEIGGVP